MSRMLRLTEAQLHAQIQGGMRSSAAADVGFTKSPVIPGEIAKSTEIRAGSGNAAAMETVNAILLPHPISANRYWRNYRGRMVVSAEARAYKVEVKGRWMEAHGLLRVNYPVHVDIGYMPRKTKNGQPSKVRLDLDNTIKVLNDALNRVAWWDDSQVVSIRARIISPIKDGGVLVAVSRADLP